MSASRRRRAIVILLIVAVAGFAAWRLVLARSAVSPGVIAVSGRIEGDDSAVAAKTSGRIREITVREGDQVEAGQVIARARRRADPRAGDASRGRGPPGRGAGAPGPAPDHRAQRVSSARARSGWTRRAADAQGRSARPKAGWPRPKRSWRRPRPSYTQAKWDREAFARLFQRELIAEQEAQARAEHRGGAGRRGVGGAAPGRGGARRADGRQGEPLPTRPSAPRRWPPCRDRSSRRRPTSPPRRPTPSAPSAMLQEARANRQDLRIVAPFAGTVATRTAEPGEVVMAGTAGRHAREPERGLPARASCPRARSDA